jgi:hypothetical protein
MSSNEQSYVQRVIIRSNKAAEEQLNIEIMLIIEHEVCSDHFIRQHFASWQFDSFGVNVRAARYRISPVFFLVASS